jgi:hypothetical protein
VNRPLVPIVAAGCLALAACGAGPPSAPAQPKAEADDAGYGAAPAVTAIQAAGGTLQLTGTGAPKATVRLATPGGVALAGPVDTGGHWRLSTPAHATAAIYGLSQSLAGRTVQSEGYLLITPDGRGVLLRAGVGALTIGDQPQIGVTSFDVDRDGSAVVSGRGPAGGSVSAHVDGRKLGEGRIAEDGRFSIPLSGPAVSSGRHSLKIFGDSLDETLLIDASPAAPLTTGPFRATPTPAGLRVDWMTPGGGVQTTLVASPRPASGEPPHRVIP